jgi:3-hydroxybutyryl-CoA dehydrogenase
MSESSSPAIVRVGVVGGGLMGAGIAEVAARAGSSVVVCEMNAAAAAAGRDRIEGSLGRAVDRGKLDPGERDATLARVSFVTDLGDLADRQLVIEAVREIEEEKTEIFSALGKALLDDEAIIASNTSSIPIMKLAVATNRPDHVIGLHFFNPVPVMRLVELIPSITTAVDVVQRAEDYIGGVLGKHVIRSQDRAGFVVNALFVPYVISAIRMLESGFASAEDIDLGMVEGCSHPMGPLALADMIGLDTIKNVADSMYAEYHEPLYSAPPLLCRMVEAGLLGRKTGRGFFTYTQ